jgi:hypothetical protein
MPQRRTSGSRSSRLALVDQQVPRAYRRGRAQLLVLAKLVPAHAVVPARLGLVWQQGAV